jgi:type II secretory pathway pseudopilin PulG
MKKYLTKPPFGFSLLELLIVFVLIAILCGLLVPRFLQMQRQANIQIAQQQVDTVQKAVLAWMVAQPSVAAASSIYGNTPLPSSTAWSGIMNYLDPAFAASIVPQYINGNAQVGSFSTPQMQQITGKTAAAAQSVHFCGTSTEAVGPTTTGPVTSGTIFWMLDIPTPNGPITTRESCQPIGLLFVPTP